MASVQFVAPSCWRSRLHHHCCSLLPMLAHMPCCRHGNNLGAQSASGGGFYALPSGDDWTPAVSFAVLVKVCDAALTDAANCRLHPRTALERLAARERRHPTQPLPRCCIPLPSCSST